jgi:hypothetical protein
VGAQGAAAEGEEGEARLAGWQARWLLAPQRLLRRPAAAPPAAHKAARTGAPSRSEPSTPAAPRSAPTGTARAAQIILSVAEHHSNLVPWQLIAQRTGAVLKHVGLTAQQEIDIEVRRRRPPAAARAACALPEPCFVAQRRGPCGLSPPRPPPCSPRLPNDPAPRRAANSNPRQQLRELVTPRTKLISLAHVSNVTGAVLDVPAVVAAARAVGARVLLDACQSVPHMAVDVQALGVDWIVASSHKMMGPTGIGFLWGRRAAALRGLIWEGRSARPAAPGRVPLRPGGGRCSLRPGRRSARRSPGPPPASAPLAAGARL